VQVVQVKQHLHHWLSQQQQFSVPGIDAPSAAGTSVTDISRTIAAVPILDGSSSIAHAAGMNAGAADAAHVALLPSLPTLALGPAMSQLSSALQQASSLVPPLDASTSATSSDAAGRQREQYQQLQALCQVGVRRVQSCSECTWVGRCPTRLALCTRDMQSNLLDNQCCAVACAVLCAYA
jgi:hypothetical protein